MKGDLVELQLYSTAIIGSRAKGTVELFTRGMGEEIPHIGEVGELPIHLKTYTMLTTNMRPSGDMSYAHVLTHQKICIDYIEAPEFRVRSAFSRRCTWIYQPEPISLHLSVDLTEIFPPFGVVAILTVVAAYVEEEGETK